MLGVSASFAMLVPMTTRVSRSPRVLSAILIAGALTLVAAAGPVAADTLPPTYYPSGPQTSVDQADLAGWTLCYSGPYSDTVVPLYGAGGILEELCTGSFLLLAGGPLDDPILTVLAAAPRADVLTDTANDFTTTHNANGSEWYFNASRSWGFALGGDAVNKNNCDVEDTNGELRLCFHSGVGGTYAAGELYGGYRAGTNKGLNGSADWTRYVYQSNGITVPTLAKTGSDSTGGLFLAGGLLLTGLAALILVTTTFRRRSTI